MHTSRSTRFACSGLLKTSGMRFSATCGSKVGARRSEQSHDLSLPEPRWACMVICTICGLELTLAPCASYSTDC